MACTSVLIIRFERLNQDFDAVCLTLGAETARPLPIPGRDLGGIYPAIEYLTNQNLILENPSYQAKPELSAKGKRVVIIGGGDTGSDCLGTAHRQGCVSAVQLEILSAPPADRASHTPWPLWPLKMRTSHAHEERRQIVFFSVSTQSFLGDGGKVKSLLMQKNGTLAAGEAKDFEIPADLVLIAMGFTGPTKPLIEPMGLALDPRGSLLTDASYMTSKRGVFAAGDVRRWRLIDCLGDCRRP